MNLRTTRRCLHDVTLLCLLVTVIADSFPGADFSASLPAGKSFTHSDEIITFWKPTKTPIGTGISSNRGFKSPVFGIYLVGYVINMKVDKPVNIQACITLANNSNCQTLLSQFNSTSGTNKQLSLQAAGVLKLYAEDSVAVKIISNTRWMTVEGSMFFGHLIQEYSSFPAFYASPSASFKLLNRKTQLVKSWNIGRQPGSFKSTQSFSLNHGLFSVTQSGFYFISASIVLEKGPGDEQFYLTVMNDGEKIEEAVMAAPKSAQTITLSISTIVRLKLSTKLLLYVRKHGDTKSRILLDSSFSVAMIKASFTNGHSFHVESPHQTQYEKGEISLKFEDFKQKRTYFKNTTTLTASQEGNYIICYNLKMFCLFTSPCNIRVKIERKLFNKSVLLSQQTIDSEKKVTLSNSVVMSLFKNETISIKIASNGLFWYLDKGSTLSFLNIQEIYPALSASLPSGATKKPSNSWLKITNFQPNSRNGDFTFTSDTESGDYVIHRAGIYHVTANVIVSNLNSATASASITINNNILQTDGLTTVNSNASGKCTLSISSAVLLGKGNRVSVYVKVRSNYGWKIEENSAFSIVFIGRANLAVGFQTTLFSDVTQKSTGWNTPSDWNRPSDVTSMPWSFRSNAKLSQFGAFTVPIKGTYFVAANIIVGNADFIAIESVFIAMISINWQTNSDLLYSRKARRLRPTQTDVRSDVAFSISSVIFLEKGDTVAVKVCSTIDPSWTIRKATGFSVVLLSSANAGSSNGFLALRQTNGSRANNELIYSNWSTQIVGSGMFATGNSIELRKGTIRISQNGIYLISVTFHISLDSPEEIILGLIDSQTGKKAVCAVNTQVHSSSFINCYMALFLKSGDSFEIYLRAAAESKVSIDRACYLSAFRMERPQSYPWIYAELEDNTNGTGRLMAYSWSKSPAGLVGHGGFSAKEGTFLPGMTGYFLITSKIIFDATSRGIQVVDIEAKSANSSSISSAIRFYTTIRSSAATFSVARLLPISKFGFRQTILAAVGSKINERSSVSAAFLPKVSQKDVLELLVLSDQDFSKPGFSVLTDLASMSKGKPKSYTTNSNSLYFVSVVLVAKLSTDKLRIFIGIDAAADTQLQWIASKTSQTFSTYTFSGILRSASKGQLSIGVKLEKDQQLKISKLSKVYVTELGKIAGTIGIISSLQLDASQAFEEGAAKARKLMAEQSLFVSKVIVKDGFLVVKRTGVYILTLAVSIASHQSSIFEVFINIDGSLAKNIYAKQEIVSSGTISIVNSLYLERGTVLDIAISTTARFKVLSGSNIGLVLLENLDNNVDDVLLPVIYKSILPVQKRWLPLGQPLTLSCYCVADARIVYRWFLNGQLISSGMDKSLNLVGKSLESGEYHCEAVASSVTAVSKSVTVTVSGSKNCKKIGNACKPGNETCLNSPESHKCECEAGSEKINGKCLSKKPGPDAEVLLGSSTGLPVAAVVLAPIALFVFIFLIALTIYTYYKHKESIRRDRQRSTSLFTERVHLHVPDEINVEPVEEFESERSFAIRSLNDELRRSREIEMEDSRDQDYDVDLNDEQDYEVDLHDHSFLSISTL